MRYVITFIAIVIFLTLIFFLRPSEKTVEVSEVNKTEKQFPKNNKNGEKIEGSPLNVSSKNEIKNEPNVEHLTSLGQEIIDEVTECERKFDETLSVPINEISTIDNQSLIYVLEEFDEMKLSSPKLGELMFALSNMNNKKLSQNKKLVDNLSLVRPCRPFEKINFINELTKRYKDNESDEYFRQKIKNSVHLYLNKELEYSVNLSTVNMLSNVVMSLLEEGIFDDSMKESCELLIEDLENDFDDLVDLAEETLEDDSVDFDSNLLKKEVHLSKKYKQRLQDIIKKF